MRLSADEDDEDDGNDVNDEDEDDESAARATDFSRSRTARDNFLAADGRSQDDRGISQTPVSRVCAMQHGSAAGGGER